MLRVLRSLPLMMFLASCSSESGVLVAVAGGDVDSLEFQVGVLREGNYILNPDISGQPFDVRGRSLNSSPYEVLLQEQREIGDPTTLRVLALGRVGDTLRSFAITDPPQAFIRGEILRRSLVLQRTNNTNITAQLYGHSCWRVRNGDANWRIFTDRDMDCDGSTLVDEPVDCNDQDEAIHPGASEVCDGKENNCDGQFAAESQLCYAQVEGVCRTGKRLCGDSQGQGLDPTCVVTAKDLQAPEANCTAYAGCTGSDPLTCMENQKKTVTVTVNCPFPIFNGAVCITDSKLKPPVETTGPCKWVLFEMQGIVASFAQTTQQNTSAVCDPVVYLKVGANPPATAKVTAEFLYGTEGQSVLFQATVDLTPVESKNDCPTTFNCQ